MHRARGPVLRASVLRACIRSCVFTLNRILTVTNMNNQTDNEQILVRRVSGFAGTFSREAVDAVCVDDTLVTTPSLYC